jgi:hypothetical protein
VRIAFSSLSQRHAFVSSLAVTICVPCALNSASFTRPRWSSMMRPISPPSKSETQASALQ